MARLAMASQLMFSVARLDRSVQNKVQSAFDKFTEATFAGLHLEKIAGARDAHVRTIRIDDNFRGVVRAPEAGDVYVLYEVLPHDEASRLAKRIVFDVNSATGGVQVWDVVAVEELTGALADVCDGPRSAGSDRNGNSFAGFSDKDLRTLGLADTAIDLLRAAPAGIPAETLAETVAAKLPPAQAEAVTMLAAGYTVEEAWAELVSGEAPEFVDTRDLTAALEHPASADAFHVLADGAELADILSAPLDVWRVFLHPVQRQIAYRPSYTGPARVTGGPGTGKTVVAVHRARYLAERAQDSDRILVTTFSRTLADLIPDMLRKLGGRDLHDRVEVLNADRLAHQIVRDHLGRPFTILREDDEAALWDEAIAATGYRFPATFVRQEWRQVVLAQGLLTEDDYLAAGRPGRGVRLTAPDRTALWQVFAHVHDALAREGAFPMLLLAQQAAALLAETNTRPYRHVLVDEAQDLHPVHWRLLRAAVQPAPDDLFLVGDTHQRVYEHRVSLSQVGINVRGRSARLKINYRSTQEILGWSLGLLRGQRFDDLDSGADTLAAYRSQLHGDRPLVHGYTNRAQEMTALADTVRGWLDGGVAAEDVAVAARTNALAKLANETLLNAGLPTALLSSRDAGRGRGGCVDVGTMHRIKGLEYRCVAVVGCNRHLMPLEVSLTPEAVDPAERDNDLQRERSLLYVACTRAREDLAVSWYGQASPFLTPLV